MKKLILGLTLVMFACRVVDAHAAPLLIDFGPNRVMTSVSVSSDGTTYLVGYQIDPSSQQGSGILATIPSGSNTYQIATLAPRTEGYSYIANSVRGSYIVGFESDLTGQNSNGMAWTIEQPTQSIPIQALNQSGAGSDTALFSVNSTGNYAGISGSGQIAITGIIGAGTTALPAASNIDLPSAFDISENGILVGSYINSTTDIIEAGYWLNSYSEPTSLSNPFSQLATANSISANGSLIGGGVNTYDQNFEGERLQASVWSGNSFSSLALLTTPDGNPLFGVVLGVTDNGYAVGQSDLGGFIWNVAWDTALYFNDWASSEYGISIPTWVTSVNDIFFDGENLNFALQGSAYFLSVPVSQSSEVPEPSTYVLLIISSLLFALSRRTPHPTRKV